MVNLATTKSEEDSVKEPSDTGVYTSTVSSPSLTLCSPVRAHNSIPEAEFPDHVQQMHQDRDRRLESEYKVCQPLTFC